MSDRNLSDDLAAKLEATHALLWQHMEKAGLRASDGWSIVEFTREAPGGTELVLRPMHLRLQPPEGLECVVGIIERTGVITTECSEGTT